MSTVEGALSAQERAHIVALMAHYPQARAACIDALNYVQAQRGYVADEVLAETAALLGMSAAALDEVATFYNLIFRRKVGRHVMMLCNSVTCWMLGSDGLCARVKEVCGIGLGETSADGALTLLPIVCLGACDRAPALLLDGELHGGVDAPRLAGLLGGLTAEGG